MTERKGDDTKGMMGRTFVMGDIHGAYHALRQCLDRAFFNPEIDHLISLGDVCDGWPDTRRCVDTLLTIPHLKYILGNHDYWTLEWMQSGEIDDVWLSQGGAATIKSYQDGVPSSHIEFFEDALPYFVLNNKLFVHAGFDPLVPLNLQGLDIFLWDRSLARSVIDHSASSQQTPLTPFDQVFLGHTPVAGGKPLEAGGVWLMDTGAGWSGVLSMMDIDSGEIIVSDPVPSLYPGVEGRRRR